MPSQAIPVEGDPFAMVDTPGALPLTSQDQASRFVDQASRAVTPALDSLGNALSLPGRALYGPESAGWDRYGEAKPEEALNAAGWMTMPGLGRGGVSRDLMGMSGAGEIPRMQQVGAKYATENLSRLGPLKPNDLRQLIADAQSGKVVRHLSEKDGQQYKAGMIDVYKKALADSGSGTY